MFLIILFFVSLFRIIITITIVFLIIKWISRLFSPGYYENNQGANFRNHLEESKTTIQSKDPKKKNKTRDKGEYVDFEEIE